MPSSDDRNLSVVARSLRSSSGRSLSSQYLKISARMRGLRLVEVEDLAEQQRPERVDRRADLRPELARQRQELDRMARPAGTSRPSDVMRSTDLRVGRVAGRGEAGEVALDVGDEDRDAGLRELPGHQLERLGLAGAGGARDEAVAVEHREGDLDVDVVEQLAVPKGAAQHDARLGRACNRPSSASRNAWSISPSGGARTMVERGKPSVSSASCPGRTQSRPRTMTSRRTADGEHRRRRVDRPGLRPEPLTDGRVP